jgi:hypothetical protein
MKAIIARTTFLDWIGRGAVKSRRVMTVLTTAPSFMRWRMVAVALSPTVAAFRDEAAILIHAIAEL